MNILVIPDAHAKPDVPNDRFDWVGRWVVDNKPDVIVELGDWEDMPSLSSYDIGKKSYEGRRYRKDLESAWDARERFISPLKSLNLQQKRNKEKQYRPSCYALGGNHFEGRIKRAIELSPMLEGTIGVEDGRHKEFGWCLEYNHKVLTSDLHWVPLKELKEGDELIGFDENSHEYGRYYKPSIVEKLNFSEADLFEVTLSDGSKFKTTEDHRWLVRDIGQITTWKQTKDLKIGQRLSKYFEPWDSSKCIDYDCAYMAGLLDGEGCLSYNNNKSIRLDISQKEGLVSENIRRIFKKYNFSFVERSNNTAISFRILGGLQEILRALSLFRAQRLLNKLDITKFRRLQKYKNANDVFITSILYVGRGTIAKIQTSTKTFFADGFAHHNCYVPFQDILLLGGFSFSHYYVSGIMGRPIAGEHPATALIQKLHTSAVQGHSHLLDFSIRTKPNGERVWGIHAGCYLDPNQHEDYAGPANKMWKKGILYMKNVKDGDMESFEWIGINELKAKYASN